MSPDFPTPDTMTRPLRRRAGAPRGRTPRPPIGRSPRPQRLQPDHPAPQLAARAGSVMPHRHSAPSSSARACWPDWPRPVAAPRPAPARRHGHRSVVTSAAHRFTSGTALATAIGSPTLRSTEDRRDRRRRRHLVPARCPRYEQLCKARELPDREPGAPPLPGARARSAVASERRPLTRPPEARQFGEHQPQPVLNFESLELHRWPAIGPIQMPLSVSTPSTSSPIIRTRGCGIEPRSIPGPAPEVERALEQLGQLVERPLGGGVAQRAGGSGWVSRKNPSAPAAAAARAAVE